MSTTVDTKVVEMKFDNKQFEANVAQSIRTCEKLKKTTDFKKSGTGLEKLTKASKELNFDSATKSAGLLGTKIENVSVKSILKIKAISNALDKVVSTGKNLVKTFTLDPITDGMSEYNLKMNSIMTIMNASGKSLKVVSKYLDDLNTYADKTKYSFSDMTASIGKFTNAGVGLKDSVEAIKGVANLAAYSGSSSAQANSAMYNFSQSLSSGFLNLLDYKSIELAGMATKRFRQELIKTALEAGTLKKVGKGMYETLTTNNKGSTSDPFGVNQIRDTLQYKWVNNDVLIKTLQKFTDERTKLGQEATKAATEFKTFGEMFDALKEEAGSGWAQTWEIIFGNFNQAKKLWTQVGGFFQNVLGDMSKSRNDMLKEWAALGGRKDLIEGFLNAGQALLNIIRPIKTAFQDIFPPMTGVRLAEITRNFRDMTQGMIVSLPVMGEIYKGAKGIFSILDIITTVLSGGFYFAGMVTGKVLGLLDTNVFTLVGNIGDLLLAFHDWLLVDGFIAKGAENIADALANGIVKIIDFISAISKVVKLHGTVDDFGTVFSTIFQNGVKVFDEFVTKMQNLDHIDLKTITGLLQELGTDTLKTLSELDIDVSDIFTDILAELGIYLDKGQDKVNGFTDGIASAFAGLKGKLEGNLAGQMLLNYITFLKDFFGLVVEIGKQLKEQGVADGISGFIMTLVSTIQTATKNLNVGKTNIAGLIGEILGIAALFKMAKSLQEVAEKFGALVEAFTGIAKSFSGVFTSLSNVLNAYAKDLKSEALLKTAGAIAILAGSVFLLAQLDYGKLWSSVGALAVLAGVLTGLSVAMGKLGGGSKGAGTMAAIGISLLALASSLKILESIKPDRMGDIVKTLIELMAAFGVLAIAASKAGNGMTKSAGYFLSIGVSVRILANALKKVDSIDDPDRAVGTILKLMLGMRALSKASKLGFGQSSGLGKDILAISASLIILTVALKKIAKLDVDSMSKNSEAFVLVFGSLAGMMIMAKVLATGKNIMEKAGSTILAMSAALILTATAMRIIAKIKADDLGRVGIVAGGILAMFGALTAISHLAGNNAAKAGVMILAMSSSLILISGALVILAHIKEDDLERATKVILAIEGMFAVIVGVSHFAGNAVGTFKMVAISIGVLTAALIALSFIDKDAVQNSAICLTAVVVALAAVIAATGQIKAGGTANLALVAVLIGELAGLLTLLSGLKIEESITIAGSISILLLALAGSLAIMSKMSGFAGGALASAAILTGIAGMLGTIIIAMSEISTKVENVLPCALALGILLNALASACLILSNIGQFAGGALGTAAVLSALLIVLGPMLSVMANSLENAQNAIAASVSLGILLNSLAAACVILTNGGIFNPGALASATVLTAIVAALAVIIAGLSQFTDPQKAIGIAVSLSTLLISLSAACAILAIVGLAGPAAMTGIASLGVLVVGMGALLVAFGALMTEVPKAQEFLQNGIPVFEAIGEALGGFIGKFVGGILEGVISVLPKVADSLSEFMIRLTPFVVMSKMIGPELGDGMKSLAKAILILTAAKLVDQITSFLGSGSSLTHFAEELVPFADAFAKFASKLQEAGVEPAFVEMCGNAAKSIAEFANNIPNEGGILADIVGDNTLKSFAEGLTAFAGPFVNFCQEIKKAKIDNSTVETAMNSAKAIAAFADNIPNEGGLLAEIVGDNKLSDFAKELDAFSVPFVVFCKEIKKAKIDNNTVETAMNSAKAIAEFANTLKNHGGIASDIFGDSSLKDFAEELNAFADPFVNYCKTIMDANIDNNTIKKSSDAAKSIVAFSNALGDGDGIFSIFTGKKETLEDFGKNLELFGQGFAAYYSNIKDVNGDVVQTSTDIAKSLLTLSQNIADADDINLGAYAAELISFGENFKEFYTSFEDVNIIRMNNIAAATSQLITAMAQATKDSAAGKFGKALAELGKTSMNDFLEPLINADKQAVRAVENMLANVATAISDKRPRFKIVGGFLIEGLIEGMNSKKESLITAASSMANTVESTIRKDLDIHSPSKLLKILGAFAASGFGKGLLAGNSEVQKAAKIMAGSVKDATSDEEILKEMAKAGSNTSTSYASGVEGGSGKASSAGTKLGKSVTKSLKKSLPTKAELIKIGKTINDTLVKTFKNKKLANAGNFKVGTELVGNIQKNLTKSDSLFKEYAESTETKSGKIQYTMKNAADAFLKFKDSIKDSLKSSIYSMEEFSLKSETSLSKMMKNMRNNMDTTSNFSKQFMTLAQSGMSKAVGEYIKGLSEDEQMRLVNQIYEAGPKTLKKLNKLFAKAAKEHRKVTDVMATAYAMLDGEVDVSVKKQKKARKEWLADLKSSTKLAKEELEKFANKVTKTSEIITNALGSLRDNMSKFELGEASSVEDAWTNNNAIREYRAAMLQLQNSGASKATLKYFEEQGTNGLATMYDILGKPDGVKEFNKWIKDNHKILSKDYEEAYSAILEKKKAGIKLTKEEKKLWKEIVNDGGKARREREAANREEEAHLKRISSIGDAVSEIMSGNDKQNWLIDYDDSVLDKETAKIERNIQDIKNLQFMKSQLKNNGLTDDSDDIKNIDEQIKSLENNSKLQELKKRISSESYDNAISEIFKDTAENYTFGEKVVESFARTLGGSTESTNIARAALDKLGETLYKSSEYYESDKQELEERQKSLEKNQKAYEESDEYYKKLLEEYKKIDASDTESLNEVQQKIQEAKQARDEYEKAAIEDNKFIMNSDTRMAQHTKEVFEDLVNTIQSAMKSYIDPLKISFDSGVRLFEEVAKETEEATETIDDIIQNGTESTSQNFWNHFQRGNETSAEAIMENMQSNIDGIKEWKENLAKLSTMGVDEGLIEEVAKLGTAGASKVIAMSQMTSEEVAQMNDLYQQTIAMSGKETTKAIADSGEAALTTVSETAKKTAQSVLDNMKAQIDSVTKWKTNLNTLKSMGLADGLIEELEAMGTSGAETVAAFVSMTGSQIQEANSRYLQKVSMDNDAYLENWKKKLLEEKEFSTKLGQLAAEGWSSAVLQDLATQGADALGIVNQLLAMTPEQKAEFDAQFVEYTKLPEETTNAIMSNLASAMSPIAEAVAESAKETTKESVESIGEVVVEAVDNTMSSEEGEKVGTEFEEGVATGLDNTLPEVKNSATSVGEGLIDALNQALVKGKKTILNTVTSIINQCLTRITNSREGWKQAGMYCADGLAVGIRSKINSIANAAAEVVYRAIQAARQAAAINSPSKKFMELAYWMVRGMSDGLLKFSDLAVSASEEMVNQLMNPYEFVMNSLSNIVNDDMDITPVITPVLDLSGVRSDALQLDTMFAKQQALSLNASMEARRTAVPSQNGTQQPTQIINNEYKMEQNNYSPQALSRIDIYRQTRNQFSMLKEVVSRA